MDGKLHKHHLVESPIEAKLARTASLLNATLESTADGLLVVDVNGKIARYNQRFLAMWKLAPELFRSGDDETALTVAAEQLVDPEAFTSGVRERYSDRESEGLDVLWLRDGRVFERYTKPQRLDGEIIGRVWSFRDVTEREHVLRRTTFLADASYLLGSLDAEGALAAVVDLAVGFMADACAVDLLNGGGGPRRLRSAVSQGAPQLPTELSHAVLVGSAVIQSTSSGSQMAIPLLSRSVLLGVISFARERRKPPYIDEDLAWATELGRRASLAMENARLYRDAKEALHARDDFLAVAAHEIRGPLTVLRLAAQQLERAKGMPDAASRPLSVIVQQDRRLARFVDELVDATALRAGKTSLRLSDVDLGEILRDVVDELGTELATSKSSITISIEGHIIGFWDRSKVRQVASKLLSNAIKFGLSKPILVRAFAMDGIGTMAIMDHGIGIAEERLASIFDPFERAVSPRHYGGLGLGLYVVHELVTAMGGTVTVASRVNEWSTFTVELPQARTA